MRGLFFAMAVIQSNSAKYDRVMVVYGASHLDFEETQIEAAWGPPAAIAKPY